MLINNTLYYYSFLASDSSKEGKGEIKSIPGQDLISPLLNGAQNPLNTPSLSPFFSTLLLKELSISFSGLWRGAIHYLRANYGAPTR